MYLEEIGVAVEVGAGPAEAPGCAVVVSSGGMLVVVAGTAAGLWPSPRPDDGISSAAVLGVMPSAVRPVVGLMGEKEWTGMGGILCTTRSNRQTLDIQADRYQTKDVSGLAR